MTSFSSVSYTHLLDEIDKIAGRESGHGPDVSREGVQRDILPIVEGTTVNTRYGMVRTDHILFVAAGAFHVSKPSDLIPELQGRFPIRVELQSLTMEDFIRILTEPKSSLVKQYMALLETEGVKLEFTPDSLEEIARFAFRVNEGTENIGARRLHTIMERVLDEISFDASEKKGEHITIDAEYVRKMLVDIVKDQDPVSYTHLARASPWPVPRFFAARRFLSPHDPPPHYAIGARTTKLEVSLPRGEARLFTGSQSFPGRKAIIHEQFQQPLDPSCGQPGI